MLFYFFSCLPLIGRLFFQWVRASAPTGCSPRNSGRLLAIDSDLYVFDTICYLSCLPPIGRLCFQWVRASAPTGCSPRDSGRLLAVDLYLLSVAISLMFISLFYSGRY